MGTYTPVKRDLPLQITNTGIAFLLSISNSCSEISAHRSRPAPGPELGQGLFAEVGPLQALLQLLLGLPELGQVQCRDLLGLLNLLLVVAYLLLQLVDQVLHPLGVLPVFVGLVGVLLDHPVGLAVVLSGVSQAPLLAVHLGLQLPYPVLELGRHLAPPLHGILFG